MSANTDRAHDKNSMYVYDLLIVDLLKECKMFQQSLGTLQKNLDEDFKPDSVGPLRAHLGRVARLHGIVFAARAKLESVMHSFNLQEIDRAKDLSNRVSDLESFENQLNSLLTDGQKLVSAFDQTEAAAWVKKEALGTIKELIRHSANLKQSLCLMFRSRRVNGNL